MEIYLDHNGSGPLCKEAADAMRPWFEQCAGSSAAAHEIGRRAKIAVEEARQAVADLLHVTPQEIVFTSGGTEANNLAVKGIADAAGAGHIIISAVEHACVANACSYLVTRGFTLDIIPVDENCLVDPAAVDAAIRPDTILIAVMHSNNEVGSIQPIAQISSIAARHGIPFLSDAVQSLGKAEVDARALGANLISLSAHKFNGPQGIGALYIKDGVQLVPLHHGSGHERGLRSGTQDVMEIAGLGAAAKRCLQNGPAIREHYRAMRDHFENIMRAEIEDLRINGCGVERLVNTSSMMIPGISALNLLQQLPEIAASTGATCHTGSTQPSKVLTAMGRSPEECAATVRFSLGYGTTTALLECVAELVIAQIRRMR